VVLLKFHSQIGGANSALVFFCKKEPNCGTTYLPARRSLLFFTIRVSKIRQRRMLVLPEFLNYVFQLPVHCTFTPFTPAGLMPSEGSRQFLYWAYSMLLYDV
jgi:hypothetical protein